MASTAGNPTGWAALAGLLGLAALWPTACVDQGESLFADDAPAVLDGVATRVVLPALTAYEDTLPALADAVDSWAADGDPTAAQAAFATTMAAWQVVDILRVAPDDTTDPLGLRDETYSWPFVNACRVDQVTATGEYSDLGVLLVNARGLDALEYLLVAAPENTCAGQIPPNSDGAWDALSSEEIATRRAAYAQAVVADLADRAAEHRAVWEAAAVADLQEVLDGLFALEDVIKDTKLGHPVGHIDCEAEHCAEDAEGLPGSDSTGWIADNLAGFELLFTGGDGLGIDDLLISVGGQDVVDSTLAHVATAEQMALDLDGSVAEAIAADEAAVEALYAEIDLIDEYLRNDITTLLLLQIPAESAGDND